MSLNKQNIQNIYGLSPMQEGMFFHALYQPDTDAYFEQASYRLHGALDMACVQASLNDLVRRYDILRTVFIQKDGNRPLQVVLKERAVDFIYRDLRGTGDPEEQVRRGHAVDRAKRFDLGRDMLMRVTVLQLGDEEYEFIWSHHHILMDGWCLGVLIGEFLELYSAHRDGRPGRLPPTVQYRTYIDWLQKQDREASLHYWETLLAGYEQAAAAPLVRRRPGDDGYVRRTVGQSLDRELTARVEEAAAQSGVTLNTFLQTLWAVLVGIYRRQRDVVFGTVVSGRPGHLPGIERMVGLCINTVPVRVQWQADTALADLLRQAQQQAAAGESHHFMPLAEIQGRTPLKHQLLDHLFIFENYPVSDMIAGAGQGKEEGRRSSGPGLRVSHVEVFEQTNYDLNVVGAPGAQLHLQLVYNSRAATGEDMQRLLGQYVHLIAAAATTPARKVAELDLLDAEERRRVLLDFNDNAVVFPTETTIQECFAAKAAAAGERAAILAADGRPVFSYIGLDRAAGRLAHHLHSRGIGRGDMVMVLMERSPALVLAVYAVLKCGAAYVPVDAEYPAERIRYILADSGAKLVLGRPAAADKIAGAVPLLDPGAWLSGGEGEEYHCPGRPDDPAYVIYTSGSTGRPKGVVVEQRSVLNILHTLQGWYPLVAGDTYLLKTSFVFDVSVAELFGWFWEGGRLAVAGAEDHRDPLRLLDIIAACGVTHLNFVPSMFTAFLHVLDEHNVGKLASLRYLMLAGEALAAAPVAQFRRLAAHVRLENIYGPTECTIYGTRFSLEGWDEEGMVPIGRPVSNIAAYVLDEGGRPLPVGVTGELFLSGIGVARGYLNNPALTRERFLPDPFRPGQRMYRTGDLVRWRADGVIEFLGRVDFQVKVRGFRIELEEIAAVLRRHEAVREAVAAVKRPAGAEDQPPVLYAYITAAQAVEEAELLTFLAQRLPEYMVPARVMVLEAMPLSAVGKINTQALPVPESTGTGFVAPRNAMECRLAEIWSAVLGRGEVGINDNFFQVGGDSIKAIQIISRLSKAGLKLEARDIFQYPTIAGQALRVRKLQRLPDQGPVVGEAALSPIQREFFRTRTIDTHHFNQSVLLHFAERLDEAEVREVFARIQDHHDALRAVFHHHGEEWVQRVSPPGSPLDLRVADLRAEVDPAAALKERCAALQAAMDLENGPLLKLGLFHMPDGDRLLITAHHLVIDGVSWRILFEDIDHLLQQYRQGGALTLPPKTLSYREWVRRLQEYGQSPAMQEEAEYWQRWSAVEVPALPVDFPAGGNQSAEFQTAALQLSPEETERLLTRTHHALRTETNDILLTALTIGAKRAFGLPRLAVALEGHGREEIGEDLDVTRTVGWFTSEYPVVLEVERCDDPAQAIVAVKEHLRRIPHKGAGFGIWRHLSAVAPLAAQTGLPAVSFNFLGQFDADVSERRFVVAAESSGPMASPRQECPYEWMVSGMIAGGRLQMTFSASRLRFRRETLSALAEHVAAALRELIAFCAECGESRATPSDLTCRGITIAELQRLRGALEGEIEDVFPLTPMQQGMLFHALLDDASAAFFVQHGYRLQGELRPELVPQVLQTLFQRYEVLRSVVVHQGVEQPVQVVLRARRPEFVCEDISTLEDKEAYVRRFKEADRERSFRLDSDVLLRVAVLRLSPTEFEFIWSFHHILMDGWCSAQLVGEFMALYRHMLAGHSLQLPPVNPQRVYIQWLQRRDPEQDRRHWTEYLADYGETATLGNVARRGAAEAGYRRERLVVNLDAAETARLQRLAAHNNVTLNTLVQAAWGFTLGRYTGRRDVVFGAVVSGRPAEIPGVEQMIGLFINTVPVRIRYKKSERVADLLRRVQAEALQSEPYHYYPLARIQADSPLKNALLDHVVVFENYPLAGRAAAAAGTQGSAVNRLQVVRVEAMEQINYDFSLLVLPGETLTFELEYNACAYDETLLAPVGERLLAVCRRLGQEENPLLAELEELPPEQRRLVLEEFNATAVSYAADRTLRDLFHERAAAQPHDTALIFVDGRWSYDELRHRARALGRAVRDDGVRRGDCVAILCRRRPEMIAAILAVWEAGATYVPIDPLYPVERREYMLETCRAALVLHDGGYEGARPARRLDDPDLYAADGGESESTPLSAHDAAYVIFTSGTTGRPKGVVVEHDQAVNTLRCRMAEFAMNAGHTALQLFSFAFDGFVTSMFTPLLSGAASVLLSDEESRDVTEMAAAVEAHGVTHFICVPPLFRALVEHMGPQQAERLQCVALAGDRLTADVIEAARAKNPRLEIVNEYGVTEAAVMSTIQRHQENESRIRIGRPIWNTALYILDEEGRPQPPGVAGELYIAGRNVARGYIGNEALTAERFLPDPFVPGRRMYRSGDEARWLPDGSVEWLGRLDDQVKLSGYRIELGEIQSRLREHPAVSDGTVVLRRRGGEHPHLCAYYTAAAAVDTADLRAHLGRTLPEYMIPAFYVHLPAIPLTPNGKVDAKALPDPVEWSTAAAEIQAPAGAMEERLLEIWRMVLGRDDIGVSHNFFAAGGDSIKAIQILSRLSRAGYKVEMKEIFQYPTVADLAPRVRRQQRLADQGDVSGEVPLTPVQRMFFATPRAEPHHYNQGVVLFADRPVSADMARAVFARLQRHHDMLRAVYRRRDDGVVQTVAPADMPLALLEYDLRGQADARERFAAAADALQGGIDLENGPLLRVGLFHCDDGDRLVLAVHHLVVDGVSWRILLEDIETLAGQCDAGEPLALPPKTDSFRLWAEKLREYASSPELLKEREYWRGVLDAPPAALPLTATVTEDFSRDEERLSFRLSKEETALLLGPAHVAFGTEINDLLLGALALACREVFAWPHARFTLEGHGREDILDDVDVSRTVGWFTSEYPVMVAVPDEALQGDPTRFIKETKESFRRIPHKGVGYGILKYLTPAELKTGLHFTAPPGIGFNYLGQFDGAPGEVRRFAVSQEGAGRTAGENDVREHAVTVQGMTAGGVLSITTAFNRRHMEHSVVAALNEAYRRQLVRLASFCVQREEKELTPSDLTYRDLSIDDMEAIDSLFSNS